MHKVEVMQEQAGENTDVILGMGYDSNLGDKLGITLIATGFEHKDPFAKTEPKKEKGRKIVQYPGSAGKGSFYK